MIYYNRKYRIIGGIKTIADLVLWIEENEDGNATRRIVSSNSEKINDYLEKAKPIIDKRIKELDENDENPVSIEYADLSLSGYYSLINAGIDTMNELATLSDEEICKIKVADKSTLKEILAIAEAFRTEKGIVPSDTPKDDINLADITLEAMDFSVRTYNCLHRHGIKSMQELANLSDEELLKVRNLGRRQCEEVKSKIESFIKQNEIKVEAEVEVDENVVSIETSQETSEESKTKNDSSKPTSKLEEIRAKKAKLEEELESLEEQTRKAKNLLAEYNELLGEDKTPDFKEE